MEIKCLEIKINDEIIKLPKSVYSKFYEVSQCQSRYFYKPIEVYTSKNAEYIFIYIRGGHAADMYLAKLIFHKKKFITEIIADYFTLMELRAFVNDGFIGF